MIDKKRLLPPPLVLRTEHPRVGIRLEDSYDRHSMRRLSVNMTVDGVDWAPVFCPSPVEAAEVVHALFSILDRYGLAPKETGRFACASSAAADNDALLVDWGHGEGEGFS